MLRRRLAGGRGAGFGNISTEATPLVQGYSRYSCADCTICTAVPRGAPPPGTSFSTSSGDGNTPGAPAAAISPAISSDFLAISKIRGLVRPYPPGVSTSLRKPRSSASLRARCAWVESDRDSRISEILIQPVGWAEASRRWQSLIRKTCVTA